MLLLLMLTMLMLVESIQRLSSSQDIRTIRPSHHQTYANAINNADPIVFASGQAGLIFDVFANKRRVPMKFDPGLLMLLTDTGKWYIQCKDGSYWTT